MSRLFSFVLLLSAALHSALALRDDDLVCQVSLVWSSGFKNPTRREFVCETLFVDDDAKEKPLPPIIRLNLPRDFIKVNKDALKSHEWYISFPSSWISDEHTTGSIIEITLDDKAVSTVDPALVRKYLHKPSSMRTAATKTKSNRQARETQPEENALIILVSTDNSGPITLVNNVWTDLTPSRANEIVFGNGDPGTISAASQFEACSFGEFKLVQYDDVLEVTVNGNVDQYDKDTIRLEARKLVCTSLNLSEMCSPGDAGVDHLIYVVPFGLTSDIEGEFGFARGEVGGRYTIYQGMAFAPSTILHETGHNFNLGHAREGADLYGDDTAQMGSSFYTSFPNGDKRCFNGWNMWEMGWLKDRWYNATATNPNVKKLATFVDYELTSPDQFVNIRVGNYYITYNRAKGINENTMEYKDKILVVEMLNGPEMINYHDTELVAALDADTNTTFRVNNFDNTGQPLIIQVCDIVAGPPDYAEVAVGLDASCNSIGADVQTTPPTATPTVSPTLPDIPVTTSIPTLPPTHAATPHPTDPVPIFVTPLPTMPPTSAPSDTPDASPTTPSTTLPPTSSTTTVPTQAESPLNKDNVNVPDTNDEPTKDAKSNGKSTFRYLNSYLMLVVFTLQFVAE